MIQDSPSSANNEARRIRVPRHVTLDGFAKEALRHGGLAVTELEPLAQLYIRTQNTTYKLTVLDPSNSEVVIQGGEFFTEPAKTTLVGSSFGGSLLKLRWIGVGMRLEINNQDSIILTSTVRSIHVKKDASVLGPF